MIMRFHFKFLSLLICTVLSLSACGGLVVEKTPLEAPEKTPQDARPAPIGFNKIRYQIPTGTPLVSRSPKGPLGVFTCSAPYGLLEQEGVSARLFPNDDYRRIFLDTMEGQGYDVAGDPGRLFDEEEDLMRAAYSVGARVIDVKADLCRKTTFLTGVDRGSTGEASITIEWTVYDLLERKNAYKTTTKGYGKLELPNYEAVQLLLEQAFAAAAHNLGADQEFHDLVFFGTPPKAEPYTYSDPYEEPAHRFDADESVSIPAQTQSQKPAKAWLDTIVKNTVLIQAGQAHGSGFFITEQGHIITNAHVVGNADRVRVVTSGKDDKLTAAVLRVDRKRDVALLRLEQMPDKSGITVLPVRLDRRTYLPEIQADVTVHGGNSGGPLLDEHGNIIGLSVSGYVKGSESLSGLNNFIPIESALEKLDIEITPDPASAGEPVDLKP